MERDIIVLGALLAIALFSFMIILFGLFGFLAGNPPITRSMYP